MNQGGYNSGTGSLQSFTFDDATGNLTPTALPVVVMGGRVLRIDPAGKFIYVAGSGLLGFVVDQTSGTLTAISGLPSAFITDAVVVSQ